MYVMSLSKHKNFPKKIPKISIKIFFLASNVRKLWSINPYQDPVETKENRNKIRNIEENLSTKDAKTATVILPCSGIFCPLYALGKLNDLGN